MSDFSWKNLAPKADYKTLNKSLNGLPDFIRTNTTPPVVNAPAPVPAEPEAPETPNWLKWLASFNQGVVEGVPFAKSALNKLNLIPASQKKLMEESKAAKPGANIIGNIAGGFGATSAVPMLKPAVAGAKGLAKAILPSLARNAVNATTFAVPSAISQAVETGDIKGALKTGLIGIGSGAVLGAAGEALGGLVGKGYKAVRNWLDDTVLKAGGVRSRELMKVLQGGLYGKAGVTPQRAQALKSDIADVISGEGLRGKQAFLDFFEDRGKIWNEIDDAWTTSGAKVDDFLSSVTNHPDVLEHLTTPDFDPMTSKAYADYTKSVINDIFSQAGSRKDLPDVRALLTTQMKNGLKKGTNLGQIEADVSGALQDAINNAFVPTDLRKEYPALLALKKSFAWNEATIPRVGGGSATAPRQMVKEMLTGAFPGAAIGGAGAIKQFDPNDRSTWLPALGIFAGSTLAGGAATRLLPKLSAQLMGRLAAGARQILPKEMPAALGKLGSMAGNLGARGGAAAASAIERQGAEPPVAQQDQPVSQQDQATTTTEAGTPPEAITKAREAVNTQYHDKVMAALANDWESTFSMYASQFGITFEDFAGMVSKVTEGFDDPKKTARILFRDPKERDKFLADYDAALQFQGMDVNPAMEYASPAGFLGMGGHPAEEMLSYQNLVDYLSKSAGQGKETSEAERKRIEARLKAIAKMKNKPEEKRALIKEMLASYGVDFARLSELGLQGA